MSDFQVRNEEAEKALKKVGEAIIETLPKGMGFALLVFDYGDKGSMFYLSSAQRADMIEAMKEFIHKEESKQ